MFWIALFFLMTGCGDSDYKYNQSFDSNIANVHTTIDKDTKIKDDKIKKEKVLRASIRTTKVNLDTLTNILSIVYGTNVDVLDIGGKKDAISLALNFKDVSLDEIADRLTMGYNLYCKKTSTGYTISPPALQTKIFNIDYTSFKRNGVSTISISSSGIGGQSQGGLKIDTSIEDNFWEQVSDAVKLIVYDDADKMNQSLSLTPKISNSSVAVDTQSGAIIVRALPRALQMIQKFVDKLQAVSTKQVFIEAKILEIKLKDSYQNGIDWNLIANAFPGIKKDKADIDVGWSSITFNGSMIHKSISGLNLIMNALSKQGRLSVLSSPTLSVSHNQVAMIKVGKDKFVVENVDGLQVAKEDEKSSNFNQVSGFKMKSYFHGIALETGVNVLNDEEVMMHLHPMITRVKEEDKTITIGNAKSIIPVATIDVREVDTVVRASNNDIIVLAGLSKNVLLEDGAGYNSKDKKNFFSFLMNKQSGLNNRTELVILIRPIIGGASVSNQLRPMQDML